MGGSSFALLVEGGGGIVLGLTTGFVASFLMRHIRDDVGVMTISLALALSTYRLAVAFGISGPLAVVVCGLMLSDKLAAADTDNGERERLVALWSVVEGLLNTLLFMLMGFEVLAMDLSAFHGDPGACRNSSGFPLSLYQRGSSPIAAALCSGK